jgi:2-methylisocitrate lyase-like PEP mutase family enzyme
MPDKAARLRALHKGPPILVLPNAWDAASARLVESRGARAIATTSAGVAWSHGYADGDLLPVPMLVSTVSEIARVVTVPVSTDVEGGYSSDPAAVGEAVARVLDAGAVGINIEDGTGDPDLLCAKIEESKRAGVRIGVDLFVNARADVYLRNLAPAERRLDETVARAERYRSAGADGIFVPGLTNADEIRKIASAVRLPLNVLARPGLPPASELQTLGVRRLTAGSWIAAAALGKAGSLADLFLRTGASEPLTEGGIPYAEFNALMAGARRA